METGAYKVSVIMPVYKVEAYIAKAIESVLAQTHTNFELLVVNDGSPDKSVEIAEGFAAKDPRIQILHKPNGGLSDARNFGLDRASGDYVYFVDSDDWVEPDLLSSALQAMVKEKAELVVFGYQLDTLNKEGALVSSTAISTKAITFSKKEGNLDIDTRLLGILGYAWNKLYDRNFLEKNKLRFTKGVSLVEDILFNSKVYALVHQIVVIDKPLYHYMNRPVLTLIKMFHPDSFGLYLQKRDALEGFLTEWAIPEGKKQKLLATTMFEGIRYCANNLLVYGANLSKKEKYQYFKAMVQHPKIQEVVSHYPAVALTDHVYKFLVRTQLTYLLFNLLKLAK